MSLFLCPICAAPLAREGNTYRCPAGHSYDVARSGYVHLLPANKKHSADPGDDRDMTAARTRFLDGGWYAPLRQALCDLALAHAAPGWAVLDAGCGEGYYTEGIFSALQSASYPFRLAGVDLSKSALKKAARRVPGGEFAVASVDHLPVAEGGVDLVLDCFAPLALGEYRRVLRPGGLFLYVVPGPRHLMELKQVLYDRPYENPEQAVPYEGFQPLGATPVDCRFRLDRQGLLDLFHMTPYAWKTPREGVARLEGLDGLEVSASFRVHAFRRQAL